MKDIKLVDDFLNANKILFHFGRILEDYYAGKRNFNPVAMEIHPTAMCNHRCAHCSYTTRNEKRTTLKKSIMDQLTDEIIAMNIKAVYFSGGGEPTLYPGISAYVEKLHRCGVAVSLITNGTYFDESGIHGVADRFNYIAVSVPATIPQKFEEITGRPNLEKVMALPSRIKEKCVARAPVIGARVVVTNKIVADVPIMLNDIKSAGYDYALFKIVRDYEDKGFGLNNRETEWLQAFIRDERDQLDDQFTNLRTIFNYRAVPINKSCVINDIGFIANVDSDGKVYPNIVEIGDPAFCVGDLNDNLFHEIWNSERHSRVKQVSQSKCVEGLCKNCRAIAYNHIIEKHMAVLPQTWDNFI